MTSCPEIGKQLQANLRKVCPTLVLASQSPNRKAVLENAGVTVVTRPQDINEICGYSEPAKVVMTLASQKLESYLRSPEFDQALPAIGIDTLVYMNGVLLGKPKDKEDATRMVSALSGAWHEVYSGLSVFVPGKGVTTVSDVTRVLFRKLTEKEIAWYVDSGECMGAAGSYKIQQNGYRLIECIDGSFSNIIGIPLEKLVDILEN